MVSSFLRAAVFAGLAGLLTSNVASAQNAQQPAAPAPPLQAGFQDGFFVQAPNGDYRLVFGMVAQADGRFVVAEPAHPFINTFTIRKLRPTFSGRIARYFDFKIMPDFGNGTAVVADMYFDIRFSPKFRIRTGKDKTPIGLELLQGDAYLFFPERAIASSLVPNRDTGVQVQGDILSNHLFYAAGVFNGIPDGSSSTTELDLNSGKDLAGRVVLTPWRTTGTSTSALSGLGFALGGSAGQETGPQLPTFRTSITQVYYAYALNSSADGLRRRVTPSAFYYYKSLGGFGEYMRSSQWVSRNGARRYISNNAWEVTGSYMSKPTPLSRTNSTTSCEVSLVTPTSISASSRFREYLKAFDRRLVKTSWSMTVTSDIRRKPADEIGRAHV